MHRCRFCGEKITPDSDDCPHCGKVLRKKDDSEKIGLTNINSWENKSVPSWVMYSLFAAILIVVVMLVVKGCQGEPKQEPENPKKSDTASVLEFSRSQIG